MSDILHHQLDHGCIAYSWSHGPCDQPLVVLHGLGDSAIHTYAPRFASSRLRDTPALFIDFPGFGEGSADPTYPATLETMAADVAGLLQNLGIEQAGVFAHSMGANAALLLAHAFPELASRLILAEPLLEQNQSVLAAYIAKRTEEAFVSHGYSTLVRATSVQAQRGDVAAQVFLPPLKMANPVSMHRSACSLLRHRVPDFSTLLSSQQISASLLIGSNSEVNMEALDQHADSVMRIPDAGHFMMAEQTDETACAILTLVN